MSQITDLDPEEQLKELKYQEYKELEQKFQQDPMSFKPGLFKKLNTLRRLMVKELYDRFY